ncbi:acyltransferase [Aureisphaera galaxeae]|uniref:acyltransferase family protein n=1 Tax=Aureisphaera galaxeae TaxID=1538023 RepID=UPI00235077C2|nr:acyltransferase [Aureisphaera galaxeae]MDC8006369.1 acyltransferase [Aureisphaera galaxeae]
MKIDYSNRIFGLDVMRTAAILFVVCSHTLWVFPEAQGSAVSLLRLCGVMGVEIFFVLSGFLIGRILFRIFTSEDFKLADLKYFLVRRWFRTLPNYYLVLLINIGLWIYFGRNLPETLPLYFGFLQNFNFGMDIFFTESWSLPIEEFAYILGPLLFYLVLLPKWKVSKKKLFLWVTVAILLFFLLTKWVYNYQTGPKSLEYWNIHLKAVLLYRIDAIYYGVLAAYIAMTRPEGWKKFTSPAFLGGILLFVGVHMLIGAYDMSPETHPFFINVLYLPLCSISIALSLPVLSRLKRAPKLMLKPITFISIVSYSMYLLHYSIILFLLNYYVDTSEMSLVLKWSFAIGYVLFTMFLSYLLYRFYEKPMMDIRDRDYFRKKLGQKKL